MKLVDQKNGKIAAEQVFFADTVKDRIQGLIGKDKTEPMMFKTRWGIHTFGVKFPIDVLVCDAQMTVRKICENVRPRRIIFWKPVWDNVFELPAGSAEEASITLGDKLELI